MSLFDADHYDPDDMLVHPRHQAMQPLLVELIQQLRDCATIEASDGRREGGVGEAVGCPLAPGSLARSRSRFAPHATRHWPPSQPTSPARSSPT
ncbi:hypothetical protein [Streptomyces fagopyri]|uniref:hypothetical protein n=1 Tax=Streptomyces fagopyri TaxID=2662397 RepID=UPI00371CEEDD